MWGGLLHKGESDAKAAGADEASLQLQDADPMLGIIAAMGAYACTGQLIPGIW